MFCAVLVLCFSLGCQNGKVPRTFAPDSETLSTAVALDDPKDNQVIAVAATLLPNKIQADAAGAAAHRPPRAADNLLQIRYIIP